MSDFLSRTADRAALAWTPKPEAPPLFTDYSRRTVGQYNHTVRLAPDGAAVELVAAPVAPTLPADAVLLEPGELFDLVRAQSRVVCTTATPDHWQTRRGNVALNRLVGDMVTRELGAAWTTAFKGRGWHVVLR